MTAGKVSARTWRLVWARFYDAPDTRPRALARLARDYGIPPAELRRRVEADRWLLEARRIRATRRGKDALRWVARGRAMALRQLARALPMLRSGKTDARTLRALGSAAYNAGHTLTAVYTVAAWVAEARQDLARCKAGKPPADMHPWGEPPKLPRAPWNYRRG